MKYINLLLLALLSIQTLAQTSLENAILKELNSYRASMSGKMWKPKDNKPQDDSIIGKLLPFKYDSALSKTARYHASYLQYCVTNHPFYPKLLKHDENEIDKPSFIELDFDQRSEGFHKKHPTKLMLAEIQIQTLTFKKGVSEKNIAKGVIATFDKSDGHKYIMIYDNHNMGTEVVGISVLEIKKHNNENIQYVIVIDIGVVNKSDHSL